MTPIRRRGADARRLLSVALAGALVAALLAAPAAGEHYEGVDELAADDNVGAAIAWSQATFDDGGASEALLGRDDLFPDALASGVLQAGRPLLLTDGAQLSERTADELERLEAEVVGILGGEEAVSAAVADDLEERGYTVVRYSGPNRTYTAVDIARKVVPQATTAIVARAFADDSGDPTRAFADSIAAGAWSAETSWPVLLTETEELTPVTGAHLAESEITSVHVVGGSAAVSDHAVAQIEALGIEVTRTAGATRFATATAIAARRGYTRAADAGRVVLTEGQAADAWAAGFAAAAQSRAAGAPLALANGDTLPPESAEFFDGDAAGSHLVCAPATGAEACTAAAEQMGKDPTGDAGVSGLPLLQLTQLQSTEGGAQVRYTFSEPVAAAEAVSDRFKVYTFDARAHTAVNVAPLPDDPRTVVASFDADAANWTTTAAVAAGAITTPGGVANPEDHAPLQAQTLEPGETRGPRLVDVGSVTEHNDGSEWRVEFIFDEPISGNPDGRGFRLVLDKNEGTDIVELRGRSSVDEVAGDRVRARFTDDGGDDGSGQDPSEHELSDITRLFVDGESVEGAATGNHNAPTATPRGSGRTPGPDLEELELDRENDQATFVFSEPVQVTGTGSTHFRIYDVDGEVYEPTSVTRSATDRHRVNASFTTFAVRNVIAGGIALPGAVARDVDVIELDADPVRNGRDHAGYVNSYAAGETHAPALEEIVRSVSSDGGAQAANVRFRFDESIQRGEGRAAVYAADGERTLLPSSACSAADRDLVCQVSSNDDRFEDVRDAVLAAVTRDAVRPTGAFDSVRVRQAFANIESSEGLE